MAIGIPINPGSLNQQAGQIAVNLRDACTAVINLQNTLVSVGTAGLIAGGFTSSDATAFMTVINELNTVALVYFGQASQPTDFNFNTAAAGLTAGN